MTNIREIFINKGFERNIYEGKQGGVYWEKVIKDEGFKKQVCDAFGVKYFIDENGMNIDTVVLQIKDLELEGEDNFDSFKECQFYCDCDSFYMEIEDFIECLYKT